MIQTLDDNYIARIKCPQCNTIFQATSINDFLHISWGGSHSYNWYDHGDDGYGEIYRINCPKCGFCNEEKSIQDFK